MQYMYAHSHDNNLPRILIEMPPKGLSINEKRDRLLNAMYSEMTCFNLKEIEKLGTSKGIILVRYNGIH